MKHKNAISPFKGLGSRWLREVIPLILLIQLIPVQTNAQTQGIKQLQLDIQKLAQLKAMLSNMYQGYAILSNGYDNIKNQSLANFNLHKTFIDGLSLISPAVKNAPAITAILSNQAQIVSEYRTTLNQIKNNGIFNGIFNARELDELTNAYGNILLHCSQNLILLQQIITAGKLQMSEADRLNILESLRTDMDKQLVQLRTFTMQACQMAGVRAKIKKENQTLRNAYGIAK